MPFSRRPELAETITTRAARRTQTAIGLVLALAILAGWFAAHLAAVFWIDWTAAPLWSAALLVALEAWLFTGLFIVAHEAMHGALAPGRPRLNRSIGRLVLRLYAGLSYDRLLPEHHKHHRRPGTADDPDFCPDHPRTMLPWFARFMAHY